MLPLPRLAAVAAGLLLAASVAHAKPAHKKALADHYGPALPPRLADCRTCHVADTSGDDESEKPHNPFGARLKAVRDDQRKAGKPSDLAARLDAVADEDSDKDGISNILELLSGHAPGDAADKPSDAELSRAREAVAAWRRGRAAYAWKPFEPVRRPAVPTPRDPAWARSPIDAFLAVEHEKQNLTPRPEAPRAVLLRRVYLDLIGLPPTREELHAFLADTSPDAYEKVVARLLDSPQYGERWGRHWMDVWRYSDWAGYGAEVRESQPHIWRWRDWIIESLNADKGYDRMVQEMLAGDELAPADPDTLRATGFLVRHWYVFNRNTWLDNVVEHTAKAFLGVTLNCARCHDHFYDAIRQEEYFQVRAFFEPYAVRTDRLPGEPDRTRAGLVRAYDAFPEAKTFLFVRGNEAAPEKDRPLAPAIPAVFGAGPVTPTPVPLPLAAHTPDKQEFVCRETMQASEAAVTQAGNLRAMARRRGAAGLGLLLAPSAVSVLVRPALAQANATALELADAEVAVAEARRAALGAVLRVERLEDDGQKNSDAWKQAATEAATLQRQQAIVEARRELIMARLTAKAKLADATKALARAEQAKSQPATTAYTPRPLTYPRAKVNYGETPPNTPYPTTSTGRRLALARWITDRANPLTARVAMNHIWMRHFGRPLVSTVFDFGRNGQPPSHPALLDWLADEFMRRGWSMKAMHRLIVLSRAYRLSSTPDPSNVALDPENRWLWRMTPRRLEAESVRDAVLHVAGSLDPTMGGPERDHAAGLTEPRRSIYFRHAAEKQMEFLRVFDGPSVVECYRRSDSVVPQQALALANSTLVLAQARLLARRLTKEHPTSEKFLVAGFETILGRPPTAAEVAECADFLRTQEALLRERGKLSGYASGPASPVPPAADPALRAREDLVQVLFNHNEFVTIR